MSDVFGFLDLAVRALKEPHRANHRKFIVLATDGKHAYSELPLVRVPDDTTLLIVNTRKNSGDLKFYPHLVFTSFEAAFNYILNN